MVPVDLFCIGKRVLRFRKKETNFRAHGCAGWLAGGPRFLFILSFTALRSACLNIAVFQPTTQRNGDAAIRSPEGLGIFGHRGVQSMLAPAPGTGSPVRVVPDDELYSQLSREKGLITDTTKGAGSLCLN